MYPILPFVFSCAQSPEPDPTAAPSPVPIEDAAGTTEEAPEAAEPPSEVEDPFLIRGAYIAQLGGCATCHTAMGPDGPDIENTWAGGFEYQEGELGVWRSPNITQDTTTGIGGWTDEQIIDAIREGRRPDGSQMLPMMPYPFFNAMSDADAAALVAFLRTIEPISNVVAPSEMNIQSPSVPPATGAEPGDDDAAQGQYLATLTHCAMCHTPLGAQGAPDMSLAFAGGMPFGMPPALGTGIVYASNITPHETSGIGLWTEEEIMASFRQFSRTNGPPIIGPMLMYARGWSSIPDDDARRIAKFIKSIPAIDNEVPDNTAAPHPPTE